MKLQENLLLAQQLMVKETEYKKLSMQINRAKAAGLSTKNLYAERDEVLEELRLIKKAIKA